jgi:hypothetical protein
MLRSVRYIDLPHSRKASLPGPASPVSLSPPSSPEQGPIPQAQPIPRVNLPRYWPTRPSKKGVLRRAAPPRAYPPLPPQNKATRTQKLANTCATTRPLEIPSDSSLDLKTAVSSVPRASFVLAPSTAPPTPHDPNSAPRPHSTPPSQRATKNKREKRK